MKLSACSHTHPDPAEFERQRRTGESLKKDEYISEMIKDATELFSETEPPQKTAFVFLVGVIAQFVSKNLFE